MRNSWTSSFISTCCILGALLFGPSVKAAYPDKPITIVVPYSAGGPVDAVARTIAGPMSKYLGQPVVVENVLGASGTVATKKVAQSKPDGYTLFLQHLAMASTPAFYDKLGYDPLTDFEYVGQIVDVPMVLLGRKDLPPKNAKELVEYIKANQLKVNIANAGPGGVAHLCGLMLMSRLGVRMTEVPYKGTAPALTDLLGGQVDLLCDQTTQTVSQIKSKAVKAYGVASPRRLASLPDVPTLDEQGVKGIDISVWHGLYAPKGTDKASMKKMNDALKYALKDPDVIKRFDEASINIVPPSKVNAESLSALLESEINKWGPIIRKANIDANAK
jgi:tripartite-type tricarboxylate transporter receptor subunit TctC